MTRARRILVVGSIVLLVPTIFVYDVVRAMVDLEVTGIRYVREALLWWVFAAAYLLMAHWKRAQRHSPAKEIGRLLTMTVIVLAVLGVAFFSETASGAAENALRRPNPALTVLWGTVLGCTVGVLSLWIFVTVRSLALFKRTRRTRRNLTAFVSLLLAASLVSSPVVPLEGSFLLPLMIGLTVVTIAVLSFRQNWIVYLSRREKIYTLTYSGLLFVAMLLLTAYLFQGGGGIREFEEYSKPLLIFSQLNALLAANFFGMTFASTLFHLPTAEVFERKQSELNSLQNLTKLTTQVLDFDTLVDTVAQLTCEVCGAQSVWLELFTPAADGTWHTRLVAHHRISESDVNRAMQAIDPSVRQLLATGKIVQVDDTWSDRRTGGLKPLGLLKGSLVSIPLMSQSGVIGALHASKTLEHGFDKDDVDVLTTFGDHVTIAIENARLIAQSIERERFQQELLVARRMQKQLLPHTLPRLPEVDIAAMSESSTEVGGDYYDVFRLSDTKWGLAVGDVSGKGVSAAFYMAEVKGIVLSLSKVSASPKELLVRANAALQGSLEKKSFVSIIYAILDTRRATILLARAGHCPVVFAHAKGVDMIRPGGIGIGMADSDVFEGATEEQLIRLRQGDVCVLYTDGITEARGTDGEEYGYERLKQAVRAARHLPAEKIKEEILSSVRTFVRNTAYTDDMTLVVIKWLQPSPAEAAPDATAGSPDRNKKEMTV